MHQIKIAIVSDLHCHPSRNDGSKDDTYLLTDKLRVPQNDHPVESLVKLINEKNLKVDITLCPGDFTDKANVQGFIAGWNFALEINRELGSNEIIATLGNHDVDVHNNHSNYTLEIAKGIKQNFPFHGESACNSFWANGCAVIEKRNYRVLVINSAHFHQNKDSSKSGKVGHELLEFVSNYFGKISDDKINLVMSHHHPIDHSRFKLGELDKIVNADELLELLGKYKFDLFVHGHKHDPLIRYHTTTNNNYRIPIFSSGSFASSSNLMFTSVRNFFHIVTLTKNGSRTVGEIQTWTYLPNNGWTMNMDESAFAPFTGFGNTKSSGQLLAEIQKAIGTSKKTGWNQIIASVPEVNNLLPTEASQLYDLLKENGLLTDSHLWKQPNNLFNTNS